MSVLSDMTAISYLYLCRNWNVDSTTDCLSFKLYLILTNLNLNGHMWLVAIFLDSVAVLEEEEVYL